MDIGDRLSHAWYGRRVLWQSKVNAGFLGISGCFIAGYTILTSKKSIKGVPKSLED